MISDTEFGSCPLPRAGRSSDEIQAELSKQILSEPYARNVRAFRGPEDVQEIGKWAFSSFASDNGFFSLYAPYMHKAEQEVISMGVSLLNPAATSTGNFTSGGTESNFSAMKAAKMWAREHLPHIKKPNIVAPYTIHPAFKKGAVYLDMEIITTEIDENGRGVPGNIANAINENTIMIAASAPSWHYSHIDPIPEIAKIAADAGLWMHVDACVGGYLSPFLEKCGVELTPWDFRVPGVMSIAADLHKYGYCPKPASTIFWRERQYQDYHYVAVDDPHLGPYKMAGFAGSRSAGSIFAAWAVLNYLGEEGYLRLARRVLELKARFTQGVNAIDGLFMRDADVMPLHFGSDGIALDLILQGLTDRGWMLLGLVHPQSITICVDPSWSDEDAELFLADLKSSVDDVRAGKISTGAQIRYG